MKQLMTLLLLTFFITAVTKAQCPDYAVTNSAQTCVGVAWLGGAAPDPLPEALFIGEQRFDYLTGGGTSIVDLALYTTNGIDDPFDCGLTISLYTGSLWFGELECVYVNSVLPVTRISFDARQKGNVVSLDWATAFEYQNREFVIERSTSGIDWAEIGRVNGAGNSDAVINYEFEDRFPARGKNYYRLKQTDTDGSTDVSEMVEVTFDIHTVAFPNPFTDQLTIRGEFELLDSHGKLVAEGSNTVLDVSHLAPGMYIVRQGQTVEPVIKH